MILKLYNIILHIELEETFYTPVEGLIVSDDVNLVLREQENTIIPQRVPTEAWQRVIDEANKKLPKKLGDIITTQGKQAKAYGKHFPAMYAFIAIIYNFDLKPPCQARFVEKALKICFKKAAALKLKDLALNPIGCARQCVSLNDFCKILANVSRKYIKEDSLLKNIYLLVTSDEEQNQIIDYLSACNAIKGIMPEIGERPPFLKM